MRTESIIYILVALFIGAILNEIGIPAGWLLGGLVVGIFYGMAVHQLYFGGWLFRATLALVGANIGFMMEKELFTLLLQYFFPLLITLGLTMASGVGLGWLMHHWTDLDRMTAYFCCIPGGASEVIVLSGEYGADNRMVAAFHTARITFFVLTIPLLVGVAQPHSTSVEETINGGLQMLNPWQGLLLVMTITIAIALHQLWKVPAGTLFYSISIGFVLSEWVMVETEPLPSYIGGVGQALIGALVGIRFDRQTFQRIRNVGWASTGILSLFLLLSFLSGFIFFVLTSVPFMTSLLSTVPAGAAEMSSTAIALNLEPTLVSSLHIIRVMVLFLLLPLLIKTIQRWTQAEKDHHLPKKG